MSAKYHERVANIEKILLVENLSIDELALREECRYGIPDRFRALVWRIFLGYMPLQRHIWAETLRSKREHYANIVDQFLAGPEKMSKAADEDENSVKNGCIGLTEQPSKDHPLANTDQSSWTSWFKDNTVVKQINNDVRRLRPEQCFFQRPTLYPRKTPVKLNDRLTSGFLQSDTNIIDKLADRSFIPIGFPAVAPNRNSDTEDEQHWEVVERILFLFAKANPGISYVQGFNEIICPIYFVFSSDQDDEWARHAEADTFYCFQNLISELQDLFIRKMDSEGCGIEAVLSRFYNKFKAFDPILYAHLERQQMKPQYFAFRWISLLLSQEFSLPDLITIWDCLFSYPAGTRLEMVEMMCLGILNELRDTLLSSDFGQNLQVLQNFSENAIISIPRLAAYPSTISAHLQNPGSNNNADNNNNNEGIFLPVSIRSVADVKLKVKGLLSSTTAKLAAVRIRDNHNKNHSK